ncbi:cupin domain-containing protein [Streptomyces halobius]|uniref:Zinc finger protein n=1 Tax=Streptomyces halobius TaxID=2879846 RepID=A0ABY4M421_9ACTN|nr:hypothetical protein [Streptomyces halobius]UQA91141.1 hypothetical protein K9S39_03900 [Streptomyces halobius]
MDGTSDSGAAGRCGTAREALGAYAIGALEPEEYGPISCHLVACPACRAELAELAKVAELLSALRPVTRVDRHTGAGEPSSRCAGRARSLDERPPA